MSFSTLFIIADSSHSFVSQCSKFWYKQTNDLKKKFSLKNVVREMSGRGNVLVGKCPVGEVSFREVSGRGMVRSGKCQSGKCPSGKCQSGNCPRGSVSRGTVQSENYPQTFQTTAFMNLLCETCIYS